MSKESQQIYCLGHKLLWIITCLLKKKDLNKVVKYGINLFCRADRTSECADAHTQPKLQLNGVVGMVKMLQSQMKQLSFEDLLDKYNLVSDFLVSLHCRT